MLCYVKRLTALTVLVLAVPVSAELPSASRANNIVQAGAELPPYLQCVPYARAQSGIEIYGNAREWWKKAEGRFKRGNRPQVGAVMVFRPHRNMRLGHVAAVSKLLDSRTVLLRHANWSPINGRRGQIENDVRAIDVSSANDWSQVRVWYDPIQAVGKTAWPVHGFIYSDKAHNFTDRTRLSRAVSRPAPRPATPPSRRFLNAFANLDAPAKITPTAARAVSQPKRVLRRAPVRQPQARTGSVDDFAAIIARYE